MKILCLSYEYPRLGGGGSVVCQELSTTLAKLGHQVDVITSHFKGLPLIEKQEGVNVYRVKCIRRNPCYTNTLELVTLLRPMYIKALELMSQYQYGINHTHFVIPTGFISYWLYRKTGLPYVITAHGSDIPGYNPDRFQFEHKLLAYYWRRIIHSSKMIISPSTFLKSLIKKRTDARVTVINNGFNLSGNHDVVATKKNMVLVVTRMFERKGVQYLLESIRNMQTDWEFVIVGDGPYLQTLKNLANSLDQRVCFTGFIKGKHLLNLYQAAKIFVFPSVMENFPVVLLEAMDAGCAIITTKDAGCSEVVGKAALRVESRDANGLRFALDQLMQSEAEINRLSKLAREG
ncbi:MAG: glycosyltransferase family 4 protein [Deltaproteobacteria bacterium]|nr:glycosyltransferase family 4 protein [Deltaproteobacteria bacterium]